VDGGGGGGAGTLPMSLCLSLPKKKTAGGGRRREEGGGTCRRREGRASLVSGWRGEEGVAGVVRASLASERRPPSSERMDWGINGEWGMEMVGIWLSPRPSDA
jgi:hypothetical protein